MNSPSLTALLHLHGLPPLPRSLTGYAPQTQGTSNQNFGPSLPPHPPQPHRIDNLHSSSGAGLKNIQSGHLHQTGRPSPPVPPPRPHSRRSSSSGSSFRASPEQVSNPTRSVMPGVTEGLRSAPRSLSSSPHSPHIDSGIGRSSADSISEPRAFVPVVKSTPLVGTRLDAQLAQLKKDMNHLRQQDMALLGHLLQIHQGIQDLRNVLVPPPQPAPGPLPMFHSTPTGYHHHGGSGSTSSSSRHSRSSKGHSSQTSRLSILSSGATKLFSRRSSTDKLMAEAMSMSLDLGGGACGGVPSAHHSGLLRRRGDDESDSMSSLEFGDV